MRTLQLYPPKNPPKKPRLPDIVRKLQFAADGGELVAWVDQNRRMTGRYYTHATAMYVCVLASGAVNRLESRSAEVWYGPRTDPVRSPDGRFLVTAILLDDPQSLICIEDAQNPDEQFDVLTPPIGFAGLFFTPDSSAMIAVRNSEGYEDIADVARFEMAQLTGSPKRFREVRNPFTGQLTQVPVRSLRWKRLIASPNWERPNTAALSADGQFLAVGEVTGNFHIADLKKKKVIASLQPEAKTNRDRVAIRIGFDPTAKWVVRLAGGKLFARPLAEGKAWRTKSTLGYANDFAFHPGGNVLCAVFADGQARYLDPLTGAVRQSFRWGKKPLHSVCFAPDGLTCAVGGENGRAIVWDVDS